MKLTIIILLTALLSTAPLLAQYSPCYEAASAEGKRLYNAGQYVKAKKYFNEAKDCPDPNESEVNDMIGKCNNKIAEEYYEQGTRCYDDGDYDKAVEWYRKSADISTANSWITKCNNSIAAAEKKKYEEEAARRREAKAAKTAYMDILKVEFGNIMKNGIIIDEFGSELYSPDMRWLKPKIKYNGLLDEDRTVTVDVKIKYPNGILMSGTNSPKDYTMSETFTIYAGHDRTKELTEWGDDDKTIYSEGTYCFELWHDGIPFYKTTFTIKPDSERPIYDKLPDLELIKKNAENRNYIANLYYNKKEYAKAVEWYRKAAELGSADAQDYMGVMYDRGEGVERNYDEAVKWYRKAANQSHNLGEYNMGRMYEEGRGVAKDYKMARDWYQKAVNHGLDDAKEPLKRVIRLQNELDAENKRKRDAERLAQLRNRPWEFRAGAGYAYEIRGFNAGNLPLKANENPNKVGIGLDLNFFFAARKYLGASDFFFAPSCVVSFGSLILPYFGVSTTLENSSLRIKYLDDYIFPNVFFGRDLKHGDISMGVGYYMDFMYNVRCSGDYAYEATLPSHYTGGWAGVIAYYGYALGVRALVGFPKTIDCIVEGYGCKIKTPVVILSFNFFLNEWE